jgi:hypothetical protein
MLKTIISLIKKKDEKLSELTKKFLKNLNCGFVKIAKKKVL